MNNAQQTARIGLFFLLGLALIWVTFETLSGGKIFNKPGYNLVARFADLQDLKVSDDVRMAGVEIGSVAITRLNGGRAEAVLHINPGVKVPNDATATIVMAGLIGTDYLSIDLGTPTAPALADGAEIRTKVTPDMAAIMSQLGDLGQKLQGVLGSFSTSMNGNGPGGGLFQKLDQLVTTNSAKIDATMTNLQEISTKLNNGQGTLGKLINDSSLHDQLLAAVGDIKTAAGQARDFMANAQGIVDQVKSGKGAIGLLVYDEQTAANLRSTVQNIRNVSDKLASGQGTLGKLINDDSLYQSAQGTLKKADRAVDSLNDSGPITAVGVLANSLF